MTPSRQSNPSSLPKRITHLSGPDPLINQLTFFERLLSRCPLYQPARRDVIHYWYCKQLWLHYADNMHLITGAQTRVPTHKWALVFPPYPGDVFNKSLRDMISEALNKTFNANDFFYKLHALGAKHALCTAKWIMPGRRETVFDQKNWIRLRGNYFKMSSFGKYGGCSWNMTDSNLTCYDGVKALLSLTKKYGSIFPECHWCQTWENPSQAYGESKYVCDSVRESVCLCKTHLHKSPVCVPCLQSAVKVPPHCEHHSYKSLKDRTRRIKSGAHQVHLFLQCTDVFKTLYECYIKYIAQYALLVPFYNIVK